MATDNLIKNNDDEIYLSDILKIVWKRKTMIIFGTAICVFAVIAVNLVLPVIYRLNMVIQPGVLEFDETKNEVISLDSPGNIKAIIEANAFNERIRKILKRSGSKKIPNEIKFSILNTKGTDYLKISYENTDIETGTAVLNHLKDLLIDKYAKKVSYHKSRVEFEIEKNNNLRNLLEATRSKYQKHISHLGKQITQLTIDLEELIDSSQQLSREKNRLSTKQDDTHDRNILAVMLYNNEIQQNTVLSTNLERMINEYMITRESKIAELKKVESEINTVDKKIEYNKFLKDSVQNVQVMQMPTAEFNPVRPRKILNITAAFIAGLFGMMIIAFLIEAMTINPKINA